MDFLLILNTLLCFVLTIYANPNLPRNIIDTFIIFLDMFLKTVLIPQIENDIFKILEHEKISDLVKKNPKMFK